MSQDINSIGYSKYMRDRQVDYKKLVKQWDEYKKLETLAKDGRIRTEKALLVIVGRDLSEKGINHFPENLDITTGISESWDMDDISRQKVKFDDGLLDIPYFPFIQTWKPDNKKLALISEAQPHTFNIVFSDALTIKPKKPAFSIKIKE